MHKRTSSQSMRRLSKLLSASVRRHWLLLGVVAAAVAIALVGAPAWAAPSPRPLNQTVPRPTPTSEGSPVATATPRPDDDDDDDAGDTGEAGGGIEGIDAGLPDALIEGDTESDSSGTPGSAPGGAPSSVALTANVAVGQLNMRAGPSVASNVIGALNANAEVTVEARNEDGSWWYVCCLPDGETRGWVSAQFMTPSFARAEANDLIPVFGEPAGAAPTAQAVATPAAPAAEVAQAGKPLALGFEIDPPFLWQGITGTLTITVTNPNNVDVTRAELSDELPATMTFIDADADGGGTVETMTTAEGNTLVLFRWPEVASQTSVTAQIDFQVVDTLEDGAVFDNLVGVRARNAAYNSGAVTIGMPPVLPPEFD